MAFSHTSLPTEPARLFVYQIKNKHYIKKLKLTIVQRANFKWANGVVPRHLLLPLSVGKSQGPLPTDISP